MILTFYILYSKFYFYKYILYSSSTRDVYALGDNGNLESLIDYDPSIFVSPLGVEVDDERQLIYIANGNFS